MGLRLRSDLTFRATAPPGLARKFQRRGKGSQGGERWRGRLPVPEHAPPLVKKLIALANQQKTTLREIADRAGIRYETISDWRYRRQPILENLVAAFNVLGFELAVVPKREERE